MLHIFSFICIFLFILPYRLLGCASCGSGGDDPLILYPWENWKVFAGFSRTSDFVAVDEFGETQGSLGPTIRNVTTLAVGRSFDHRSFVSLTAPYIVNRRGEYDRSSWGDPLAVLRYTVVQQDISEEWIPQIQGILGYKTGSARSVYDYEDLARLDVFGSGIPEWRAGIDVWQGLFPWKIGFAQTVMGPTSDRKTNIGKVRPGIAFRTTVTTGYGWGDRQKVLLGMNREQVTAKSIDDQLQADSDSLSYGAFITGEAKLNSQEVLRLTLSRSGAFGRVKNVSRSNSALLGFMRSF